MMDTCADPAGRTVNSRDGRQQKSSTEGQERDSDDRGQQTKLYGKGDLFLGEGMRDISSLQFASQEAIPACVVRISGRGSPGVQASGNNLSCCKGGLQLAFGN